MIAVYGYMRIQVTSLAYRIDIKHEIRKKMNVFIGLHSMMAQALNLIIKFTTGCC